MARAWDGHEVVDLAVGRLALHYAEENPDEVVAALDDKTEAVIRDFEARHKGASADKVVRQKWCLLQATMDERARRLWSGTEAGAIGWGGVAAVAHATGMAISTVRKGRDEAR